MGIVKAVIERGLRRTLQVIYFNPHPQFPVDKTAPESCSRCQSPCWRQQPGGRWREAGGGERAEGLDGEGKTPDPSHLPP